MWMLDSEAVILLVHYEGVDAIACTLESCKCLFVPYIYMDA